MVCLSTPVVCRSNPPRVADPGEVSAGPRQAVDQPGLDRIAAAIKTIEIVLVAFFAARASSVAGA